MSQVLIMFLILHKCALALHAQCLQDELYNSLQYIITARWSMNTSPPLFLLYTVTTLLWYDMYIWGGCAVFQVCKEGSSGAAGEQVAPGFWLVEATSRAAEGQHVAAAAAIGTLAALLEPLVVLQKQ